jgi:hypothetical protein
MLFFSLFVVTQKMMPCLLAPLLLATDVKALVPWSHSALDMTGFTRGPIGISRRFFSNYDPNAAEKMNTLRAERCADREADSIHYDGCISFMRRRCNPGDDREYSPDDDGSCAKFFAKGAAAHVSEHSVPAHKQTHLLGKEAASAAPAAPAPAPVPPGIAPGAEAAADLIHQATTFTTTTVLHMSCTETCRITYHHPSGACVAECNVALARCLDGQREIAPEERKDWCHENVRKKFLIPHTEDALGNVDPKPCCVNSTVLKAKASNSTGGSVLLAQNDADSEDADSDDDDDHDDDDDSDDAQ